MEQDYMNISLELLSEEHFPVVDSCSIHITMSQAGRTVAKISAAPARNLEWLVILADNPGVVSEMLNIPVSNFRVVIY